MAHDLDPLVLVGKGGVTPTLIEQLDEVLENRELVKVKVLNNCLLETDDIAKALEEGTGADRVQIIGHNVLFYRRSKEEPRIELP